MTLSRAQIDAHDYAIFCIPVRVARQHSRLLKKLTGDKSPRVIYEGRHYYAFSRGDIHSLAQSLDLTAGRTVNFTRLKPDKLIWRVTFEQSKGTGAVPDSLMLEAERACLESEMVPPLKVLEVIGSAGKTCARATDDFSIDRFRIYVFDSVSSMSRVEFEEPLTFYSSNNQLKLSWRLAESGRGIPILDRQNNEVRAELFPTELFVLLPLSRDYAQRELFANIVEQAMILRQKHFGTAEKIIAWKLEQDRAVVHMATENATALLNAHNERVRRTLVRTIARNKKRAEKAMATVSDSRRKLAIAEASLSAIGPLVTATEEDAKRLIETLRQLRSVEEVAVEGEELRVTTDTIYSTLLVGTPRRLFRIGKIEIRLNVVTHSIRFKNLTDPRNGLAAPHIRQGDHGCLDSRIEFEVKAHLMDNEWVSAIQVCIRLLTASGHINDSELWPEVDLKTRLTLVDPKKE